MERVNELCKKMGRKTIEEYCVKKNWRLPTFEEAIKINKDYGYNNFWIEGYEDSEGEQRPLLFINGKKITVNPMFMEKIVVFEKQTMCPNCGHTC